MDRLLNALINIGDLDDFAIGDTFIHRLHPIVKLVGSILMIISILSTYQMIELLVDMFIIFMIAYIAHISYRKFIKRGLIGLPLSLCLGLSFLIFNQQIVYYYGIRVSQGVILCLLIFVKTFLCLCVAYLLIATTSFDALASELIYLKVPAMFVLQLTMTYRYIFVFLNEAQIMSKSYLLRSPKSKAIELKDMGSFVGHLLIRSLNKSQSIYNCMKCRGFNMNKIYTNHQSFGLENVFLLMIIVAVIVLVKVVCL